MNKLLLVVLPTVLLSACVTTSKYKAQVAQTQSLQQQLDAANAKVADLGKQLDAARALEKDLRAQILQSTQTAAGLQQANKDLQDSLNANKTQLGQKVSTLIQERGDLEQKLNAQETQLASLNQQLADAQAKQKALEDAQAAQVAALKKSYDDVTAGLQKEIAAGQVQISQLQGKLTLNMVDQILFDSGSAQIKPAGQAVLDKVGAALNGIKDKDIRIEGHTDNKPIAGALQSKFPTNWDLSTARATSVVRYLIDHDKVDPTRLVAAGYGEFHPKASNDTPEGRAQNRRIEIILVPRD